MPIELRPTELGSFMSVPDIQGQAFDILASDPNPVTINHRLGQRRPEGMLIVDKAGAVDAWMTNKTNEQVDINRTSLTQIRIYLF
jgi:hypothetical protein